MFVVSLARASQRARRHLRGLGAADRDDILATAILWCWEHRTTYNPSVALDDWFVGAIRDARKAFERGEGRNAGELTEVLHVPDDTSRSAELQQAVENIIASMDGTDWLIVDQRLQGHDQLEISKRLNLSYRTVKGRISKMRETIPERVDWQTVIRASAPDSYEGSTELSRIDREIEQLEFGPPAGQQCSPCWLCKWFEGYMPHERKSLRMELVEPEIRAAVSNTEARKIVIAQGVRDANGGRYTWV